MVAPEEINLCGMQYFEAEEQKYGLKWVVPSVHEISDEDVSSIGRLSGLLSRFVPIVRSFSTS